MNENLHLLDDFAGMRHLRPLGLWSHGIVLTIKCLFLCSKKYIVVSIQRVGVDKSLCM